MQVFTTPKEAMRVGSDVERLQKVLKSYRMARQNVARQNESDNPIRICQHVILYALDELT